MHQPVLLKESIEALNIHPNGYYIDGTFGRGGHSRAILEKLNSEGRLLVFDKDPEAISAAENLAKTDPRLIVHHGSFIDMQAVAEKLQWLGKIAGILLDLGVSSPQIDNPERGFSFMQKGPLDMRMNTTSGITAAEWLSTVDEKTLADVFFQYGDERYSRRIAKANTLYASLCG